ncbi:IPT/TIG domain-containing protein [Acidobacteria bacterium AH-259-D05]|nr:IPT/TIG domain-containing protein [Acidobacteria bacterium AH-259-D05]
MKIASLICSLAGLCLFVYSQTQLQVGYAVITADAGNSIPVATALFSSTNAEKILVWEAGVRAVEPLSSGRIFVDQQGGTRTALALVNPSQQAVTVTLILRDASGEEVDRKNQSFDPGEHQALFVDELFSGLGDFTGSLTFQSQQEGQKVAALTLRQNINQQGEPIFATLPVVDLTPAANTESIVFPQVGAGEGLSTQLVLMNLSQERVSGQIQLFDDEGVALELELEGTSATAFPYQIEPDGTFRGEFARSSGTGVGYAVVTLQEGSRTPSGSAIFQFKSGSSVLSEAGVEAITPTIASRIFVDNVGTRTGVAIANPQNIATTVTFDLLNSSGSFLQRTTQDLSARGHVAKFADELFSDLEPGFTGLMEITSSVAIAPVSLKLTTNARNHPIITTLPIADLTRPLTASSLIFPQIGFGDFGSGAFATRLIFINGDKQGSITGRLNFFQSNGNALSVPLGEETGSEFPYQMTPGGAKQFRPGETAGSIVEIILDRANPASREMVVNEGSTIELSPLAVDANGNEVEGVSFNYTMLSPEIATVDGFGQVEGKQAGFSTLTVSAGEILRTATITVVKVTSGAPGFEITGVAQDLSRRLYLANTKDHTIRLAQDLEAMPEIYAGVSETPGLNDDERLKALFRNPAFLSLNQAEGSLFVSDGANDVIRVVGAGPNGLVTTMAGTGQPGATDGSLNQAAFNNPQGIALDNRGHLWVVDSDNHTLRRINLITGMVETIAGKAGSAGWVDGTGEEARFNSPIGIAIETESLTQQLERERKGDPPPLLSVIVADTGNGVIRRVKENGEVKTIGLPAQGPSGKAGTARFAVDPIVFNLPTGVAVDPFGNIYVTDPGSGEVKTILSSGAVVTAVQANTFSNPQGIVITESGKAVVADADVSAQEISLGTPEITSVTPQTISGRGGAGVTIRGRNFAPGSLVVVVGVLITDLRIQDTQTISFTAPTLPSGRSTLTVQNRGGIDQASLLIEAIPLNELEEGYITTVAGGTTFTGDGSKATAAALNDPFNLAVDVAGNLFIADGFSHRVRRVDAVTGIITTVAGSGQVGFSGDGGPATAAALGFPNDVAVDRAGNLFIASGSQVRKVDAVTGIITSVVGTGKSGFSGDGGPATEAALNTPEMVVVDREGNLFIADRDNHRIRKVDAVTGIITTVAGSGQEDFSGDGGLATAASLDDPQGVAVDAAGNLFIADTDNQRIRKVDAVTGIITTVAGSGQEDFSGDGGLATGATLDDPLGLAVDGAGNLFIADFLNSRIRKVDAVTGIITTVAGTGQFAFSGDTGLATAAALDGPQGVVVDGAGNLFIADTFSDRIRKVDGQGIITTVAGSGAFSFFGDEGSATAAALDLPDGVAVDGAGNLFIADTFNSRIRKVDGQGIITTVAGTGEFGFSGDEGPATAAQLFDPRGVEVDEAGNLFIADTLNDRIRRVDAVTGVITTMAGTGEETFSGEGGPATAAALNEPSGVVLDSAGNLFIADTLNHRIRRVDAVTGVMTTMAGTGEETFSGEGGPATTAALKEPFGVAVDEAGNLFIADTFNHRIRRVDATTGIITTVAGTGEATFSGDAGPAVAAALYRPTGVVLDSAGNLFIADDFNERVRRVDAVTGVITTVAGTGQARFSGDGGLAAGASFFGPVGLALDAAGNLFIADEFNNRIRAVRRPMGGVPNLIPFQPSGWSDPIVVSNTTGTQTDSETLSSTDELLVDWAALNGGTGPANRRFDTTLSLDGQVLLSWFSDPPLSPNFFVSVEDFEVGPLSAGTHILKLVVDSTSQIAESDESDNPFTKTITIAAGVPNLIPFQPSGWSDRIVVSNISGTQTDSETLSSTDTLFVDWAALNNGTGPTSKRFYTTLSVDGQEVNSWFTDPPLDPDFFSFSEDFQVGPLSAGTHTLKLVVDSTSQIVESDESDNTFTRTITVTQ